MKIRQILRSPAPWAVAASLGLGCLAIGYVLNAQEKKDAPKEESKTDKPKEKPKSEEDPGEKLWTVDFDAAKARAAKEGKDILMEFTGSDWCPPCKALKKKVFDQEAFQTEAPKHFVLLKLDSPNDKAKQSDKEIAQNEKLNKQYNIQGFPTIILADASGKPFAMQVGFSGAKPEDYTKSLIEKVAVRKTRDRLFAEAKDAQGVERAKLLGEAIAAIDGEVALESYRDTVNEIIKLDADNKAGLKGKYEGLMLAAEVKKQLDQIQEAAEKPADVVEKVDKLIADKKLTGESLQDALFLKAKAQFGADKAACRKSLEAALAAAPKTETAKQIEGILERAFKDEPKKTDEPKKSKEESKDKEEKK